MAEMDLTEPQGLAIADVVAELNRHMVAAGIQAEEGPGFSSFGGMVHRTGTTTGPTHIPKDCAWVAVFPVRGGSEGFYVHIHWVTRDEKIGWIALTKMYTWQNAVDVANFAARQFHA